MGEKAAICLTCGMALSKKRGKSGNSKRKVSATFVDTKMGRAVRVAPRLDVREHACAFVPEESRHYFAQMRAYQIMPDEGMLTIQEVLLKTPIERIVSRPGLRVNCDVCGEEIMNEREILRNGLTLCRACAEGGYYQPALSTVPVRMDLQPFLSEVV